MPEKWIRIRVKILNFLHIIEDLFRVFMVPDKRWSGDELDAAAEWFKEQEEGD